MSLVSPHCAQRSPVVAQSLRGPVIWSFLRFAVASAAFLVATAQAYVEEGASWPSGSNVTFQFALGNAGRTLIDGNTSWDLAAIPAPDAWNSNMRNLHFSSVINPSAPLSSGDHINTIAFSSTIFGQSFGSSTLAVTYYWYSGGRMSEADVLVNTHQQWDSYRGSLRFGSNGWAIGDIRRVLIHELGHALGLGHPDQNRQHVDAIMNSMISSRETVSSDDISGAQALYGAPTASPTPTPTPTATPTPTPIPTPTPTATPTPTPIPTPTPSPSPTPSATPTPTPTPSATPTPSPSGAPVMTVSVSPTIVRSGQTATFTFRASVPPSSPLTVRYAMSGTAIQGNQYTLNGSPGSVTLSAGTNSATVTLTVKTALRLTTSAIMTLSAGTDYSISTPSSATVYISM